MIIKHVTTLLVMFLFTGVVLNSYADEHNSSKGEMKHHHMKHSMNDDRVSLNLSPQMKQHQLSNMRSHLEAVQAIIKSIAERDFEVGSEIAHSKLGLSDEMKRMCNMVTNNDFKLLGLAFHESGDVLANTLKTKDVNKSLHALQTTLGYCVQCHATFRQ